MNFFEILTGAEGAPWLGSALGSLIIPSIVLAYSIRKHPKAWSVGFVVWVLLSSLVAGLTPRWVETDAGRNLYFFPIFFITLAVANYRGFIFPRSVVFGACFVSELLTDFVLTSLHFHWWENGQWQVLQGIGGAGLRDSLFAFPCFSALLQIYVAWRWRSSPPKIRGAVAAQTTPDVLS